MKTCNRYPNCKFFLQTAPHSLMWFYVINPFKNLVRFGHVHKNLLKRVFLKTDKR